MNSPQFAAQIVACLKQADVVVVAAVAVAVVAVAVAAVATVAQLAQ